MTNDDRQRTIEGMLKNASERAEKNGPPCSECRFAHNPEPEKRIISECRNPVYQLGGVGVGAGGVEGPTLTRARASDGLCGPGAMLFQPKMGLLTSANLSGLVFAGILLAIMCLFFWIFRP